MKHPRIENKKWNDSRKKTEKKRNLFFRFTRMNKSKKRKREEREGIK